MGSLFNDTHMTLVDALVDGMADDSSSVIVSMRLPALRDIVSIRLPALRETPQTNRKTNSFTEVAIQAGIPQEKEPFMRGHRPQKTNRRAGENQKGVWFGPATKTL